jgi:hypothetical protein
VCVFGYSVLLYLPTACQVYNQELVQSTSEDTGMGVDGAGGDASGARRDASIADDDDTGVPVVTDCVPNLDDDGTCPMICPEVCDNKDNDCDDLTDEAEASNSCNLANAVATCIDGACAIAECEHLFGDCDDEAANGCETPLNTDTDCGSCGGSCEELQNAEDVLCVEGVCTPTQCVEGFDDCDADASNGCETSLDTLDNCGGCGVICDGLSCQGGICSQLECEEGFADCDGDQDNGCEVSLDSVTNCGRCGHACSAENATVACEEGECVFVKCKPGFGDCDNDESNGCETALNTVTDCGQCGKVCEVPDGVASCAGGICTAAECEEGRADCDGDVENGCETSLRTLENCGVCGQPCTPSYANQTVTCETGVCQLADCETGFYDCDQDPLTGCESSLKDRLNCGECGRLCDYDHATESCSSGSCELIACEAGFGNCNSDVVDGCETDLTTTDNCGECGRLCDYDHATESCSSGSCELIACDSGFDNCNSDIADGCETDLTTTDNCGECGRTCQQDHTTFSCTNGQCVIVACESGWDNCDEDDSNGCEASLKSSENCGRCGHQCTLIGPFCCDDGTCAWWCG